MVSFRAYPRMSNFELGAIHHAVCAHARLLKERPHIGAALAARLADKPRLNVGKVSRRQANRASTVGQ
jgi:hypothetical protein